VPATVSDKPVFTKAPIPTWFGVGGGADAMASPRSLDELRACLAVDPALRVLGEGANLLVDDDGVPGLVVRLDAPAFTGVEYLDRGLVRVGAGVHLFKLINQTVGRGLAGLEVLAGVPASIGGALVMNAGGAYGQIADTVHTVFALDREGREVSLTREEIAFGYRASGLDHLIVTGAVMRLTPGDAAALTARKKQINDAKDASQPLRANSAGCCFKNPTLRHAVAGVGEAGQRVSAGMVIDRAGLKGTRLGSAVVSDRHANFLLCEDRRTGRARDIIDLINLVQRRVMDTFGIALEREVVIWSRESL